jgi:sulfite reductase (ferredoxin)
MDNTRATWKDRLEDRIDPELAREIDVFEMQIELRRKGTLEEKLFAETRLRRGVYGQRYDNGQRHDGLRVQNLRYPSGDLTKGPDTVWDAPGMQRIKIPFGGLTPDQMEVLADLAEEYADSILHVTTRQDFQLHFVHIDDTPAMMRRLAAVAITTREACGNSVRNVTACPYAGVCGGESFDVTPYAKACAHFLLGHPDAQDFGRKFKIAFSGCADQGCGLVKLHDLGGIAVTRKEDGRQRRGFELYVGGGLGAVPHQAKLFDPFVPEEELLPITQAVCRVFARLGEKKNRGRARLKFLVAKLGIDEFRRLVLEERDQLPEDPRWTSLIEQYGREEEEPTTAPVSLNGDVRPEGFEQWYQTNVYRQRQSGYATATITLPLGDLSGWQMRRLADLARRHAGENVRTTVEQNLVFRWVSEADLPELYSELREIGLDAPGAGSVVDLVACPGTDTCKLGISSSRGLAGEIRRRLQEKYFELDQAVRDLRIKISGCFNSCGQHHVADLGFYGVSRTIENRKVPHFQVVLGGMWGENAGSYGLAIGSVPSKRIPEVVERITSRYARERRREESFQEFVGRAGKKQMREMIQDLMSVPSYASDASFYTDWGDAREYTLGDMGIGECAGEVVSQGELELAAAEQMVFEAQLKLEAEDPIGADRLAFNAMLEAARGLVKTEVLSVSTAPDAIVSEFRKRFHDTRLFHDRYAGAKFADYLFARYESPPTRVDRESAHRVVEEAQLFIDAAHACRTRMAERSGVPA